MPKDRDPSAPRRPPIWFGLRPRLLGALVLTAAVTLATAALTLLAPLQSTLRNDGVKIAQQTLDGDKTRLGILNVRPDGYPPDWKLRSVLEQFYHEPPEAGATFVVWDSRLQRRADTDYDSRSKADHAAPPPVRAALARGVTTSTLGNNVLVLAARYKGHPFGRSTTNGRYFVLEMISHVDYVDTADGVVRTAFLYAALVGLAVAVLLGIALSSRLLRRLRLLRDATRSFDERELSTLVPEEHVSDEIGELAQSFSTMHARLRQQEDARRAFVATASHELRTPLASLEGMLELLAEDLATDPADVGDARTRVAEAQVQSRRLAALATDLLDLSRIDAQLELRSEPVELVETARAVTAEFDLRARERQVAVVIDQVGDRAWAQADPGSVARIVRILLDNALAVAPPDSMIEVAVGNGAGPPKIEVADEGPGVPPDERELIFERFKRGRARGSEGGFGLGLAIGSELAARMGGRLELLDGRPGATFRLTLPEAPQ